MPVLLGALFLQRGCHAANAAFSGELTKVYRLGCEFQKKRLEVAYYLKIKEAQQRIMV
jgi:uncharacterized protein